MKTVAYLYFFAIVIPLILIFSPLQNGNAASERRLNALFSIAQYELAISSQSHNYEAGPHHIKLWKRDH